MSLVELEHIRYRYDGSSALALDDINLRIDSGEFVLLAGASGSGKSTLCRLLNGLIPHFHTGDLQGTVRVDGLNTRDHRVVELFAHVGLVFQNPEAQLFNSTVERELAFGLESLSLSRAEIQARVEWALKVARLAPLRDRAPYSLSGGEQQIVALAAVLALRPPLLVLDEPFANLDPENVARILTILREVHARGTTVILAEHRLHTAIQEATRLVVLAHGRIVRDGTPRVILRDDLTAYRLHVPYVVRAAQQSGWRQIPLSVDEALTQLREQGTMVLPARRNGSDRLGSEALRVIEMHDVSFSYQGRKVLRGINLKLHRGECVALVGKNGSGKTTLLKHLNGLVLPTQGRVTVLNHDTRTTRISSLARQVGFVFQNPNDQLFKSNVREEIEVAPRALDRLDRVWLGKLYELFELDAFLDRSPFTLSEGEKKRVAFAAALAAHPEIVVLDEPTTGQDFSFRVALVRLLRQVQNQGMTIFFATHDLGFAEEVAPWWVALADGEIAAEGAPDEIMADGVAMARASLRPTARWLLQNALSQTVTHTPPRSSKTPSSADGMNRN